MSFRNRNFYERGLGFLMNAPDLHTKLKLMAADFIIFLLFDGQT